MLVTLRRSLALALLAAGAAVTTASCAENDSSIFIRGCVAVSRTDCTATVSTTSILTLGGTIDAIYAGQYFCTLLVENQLVARGDPTTLKTETSGVELFDAEVQVLDPSTADANGNMSAITQFSVPITGFIDPGVSNTPGVGTSDVVLVDAATIKSEGQKVASSGKVQTVVASVVVRGKTLGGLEVHSQEFLYPVEITAGGTCVEPMTGGCVSSMASTATADCKLGIDEPAGTDCSLIAMTVGVCNTLECSIDMVTMKSQIDTAHCPAHTPPDNSCCTP